MPEGRAIGRCGGCEFRKGALAHTLKGSARAIGAFAVAEAAALLEAAMQKGDDPAPSLAGLKDAVTEARTAIDAILRRS